MTDTALWCAVIDQALSDAIGSDPNHRVTARRWFSDAGDDFQFACSAAGIDPDAMRAHAIRTMADADAGLPLKAAKPAPLKRAPRTYTHNGETRTLAEWAAHLGINLITLQSRLDKLGWPVAQALSTPVDDRRERRKPGVFWNFHREAGDRSGEDRGTQDQIGDFQS